MSLSFGDSCNGCRFANASVLNSAPSRLGLSILVSQAIWRVNCTVISRQGRCALTLLLSCIGLTPPWTFTDIPSQSRLRLSGTTSLLLFVIPSAKTLSKLLIGHIFVTVLTHHATDSDPLAHRLHF